MWRWAVIGLGAVLFLYSVFVAWLLLAGRKAAVRAVAGFVPDCIVLFRRLLADNRVPKSRKLVLAVLVLYLALPLDLVPDFIPVAGYLDDAVLVAFALRYILHGSGAEVIEEHWPGPESSLGVVLGLGGHERVARSPDAKVSA